MRRLAASFLAIGLIWAGSTAVTAAEDDLAGLFPLAIGDRPLVVETQSGAQWLTGLDPDNPEEAAAIAATLSLVPEDGATLDEVEIAGASVDLDQGGELRITAVRVLGSRAYEFVDAAIGAVVPPAADPAVGWGWVGDTWIAYYNDAAAAEGVPVIVYPAADTVWIIDAPTAGDTPVDERIEPILEALPPQTGLVGPIVELPQRFEAPELGIIASFPEDWTVEVLPMTAEEQAVIARSTKRYGIEAEWVGTVRAVGPAVPGRGGAPICNVIVFEQTELTPSAWISAVTPEHPCYLVDETPEGLVRARIEPSDCGREWVPSQGGIEHFALGQGDEIAYLNCWSRDPPGERGSAIAESIDFLPAEK